MKPYLLFYTDKFIPSHSAGIHKFFFILIRPIYKEDKGLLAHEVEHVKQAWIGLLLGHQLLYTLSQRYRLYCEVAAYKEQAKHYSRDMLPQFALFIARDYRLTITQEEALKLLR